MLSDHLIISRNFRNICGKNNPYQTYLLQGACEAKRELARISDLENGFKLKKVRLNLQNIGEADSYGQRDFEIVLENPKTHKKLINPIKDGMFNYAEKFKDFLLNVFMNKRSC